jgi:iron(III) transport system ATP-binding protein
VSEIRIAGLQKSFGRQEVLRGVDLVVPDHAIAAVLGPSGCGKTTLLRIIGGFEAADGGSIQIGGVVVDDGLLQVRAEARRVAYVPQEGALFPHLSVAQNVGFGLPRNGSGRDQVVADALELVGLGGLERRRPNQLSGGQQQRVALARALAPKPQVILLDEPFAALDPATRTAMRAEIAAVLRSIGTTVVLVTHDQAEALSVADLVAVIVDGRVAQVDPPEELYTRPATREVAQFIGEANLVSARIDGDSATTALGRLPLADERGEQSNGHLATVVVRPEQLLIEPNDGGEAPAGTTAARVVSTIFFGHDALVTLELEDQTPPVRVATRTSETVPELGALVRLRVQGGVVRVPEESSPEQATATPTARASWWGRRRLVLGAAVLAFVVIAAAAATTSLFGLTASKASPFGWLKASAPPIGWKRLELSNGAGVMFYPPSLQQGHSDTGAVTAEALDLAGHPTAYLNATPRQANEQVSTWPTFRLATQRRGERSVQEIARGYGLSFRGGQGSCLTDIYVTRAKNRNSYREIACYVVGRTHGSVIVAAAPPADWKQESKLLEQAISAYEVR